MQTYNTVMTVAGSDSGGGAGIQADIKSISACGGFATSAITAITAQNTLGVTDIHAIPTTTLVKQMAAILSDIGTDAVKIGMLHNSETIEAVHDTLDKFAVKNIVLDPVMVATSGDKLLQDEAIDTLKTVLIPKATVITPNIPEAEILLGKEITEADDLPAYAKELSDKFGVSVLLKAGHLKTEVLTDVFYNKDSDTTLILESKFIETKNTHGTGCSLSSALATFLARGEELDSAVTMAKNYINQAITAGADYEIGQGHGAVHHFYEFY